MADEHGVVQIERRADREHVVGVAVERRVTFLDVPVGFARPAPAWSNTTTRNSASKRGATNRHVLVTSESVGEEHRLTVGTSGHLYVVPLQGVHRVEGHTAGYKARMSSLRTDE